MINKENKVAGKLMKHIAYQNEISELTTSIHFQVKFMSITLARQPWLLSG